MNIAILGASGRIGQQTTLEALVRGYQVTLVRRLPNAKKTVTTKYINLYNQLLEMPKTAYERDIPSRSCFQHQKMDLPRSWSGPIPHKGGKNSVPTAGTGSVCKKFGCTR